MAAFSCGTEALMLGSLMMLASGVVASAPSSAEGVADALLLGERSRRTRR